jgi:hypothetical protein
MLGDDLIAQQHHDAIGVRAHQHQGMRLWAGEVVQRRSA